MLKMHIKIGTHVLQVQETKVSTVFYHPKTRIDFRISLFSTSEVVSLDLIKNFGISILLMKLCVQYKFIINSLYIWRLKKNDRIIPISETWSHI